RRLYRFLHHLAKLAGRPDLALAGDRHRLDRQELAADFRPGEAGDGTNLIFFLADAVTEAADAEERVEVLLGDDDVLVLAFENLAERLAGNLRKLALECPNACFASVESKNSAKRSIREFELAVLEPMRLHLLR